MNFSFFLGVFFFGFFIFFSGAFLLVVQRHHFIIVLLSLEIMVIGIFVFILFFVFFRSSVFVVFVFLTLVVCEACLGLSLLVGVIRSHGRDFISVVNLFEC